MVPDEWLIKEEEEEEEEEEEDKEEEEEEEKGEVIALCTGQQSAKGSIYSPLSSVCRYYLVELKSFVILQFELSSPHLNPSLPSHPLIHAQLHSLILISI